MRVPRFRLTIRRLMIAVAVVGLMIGGGIEGERRRARFRRLANHHGARCITCGDSFGSDEVAEWHCLLNEKYDFAARFPWLPVMPDPPEPTR